MLMKPLSGVHWGVCTWCVCALLHRSLLLFLLLLLLLLLYAMHADASPPVYTPHGSAMVVQQLLPHCSHNPTFYSP